MQYGCNLSNEKASGAYSHKKTYLAVLLQLPAACLGQRQACTDRHMAGQKEFLPPA